MANCKRKRIIAAIMALTVVAGAAPAKPISDLFMPELSVSAAEASTGVKVEGMAVNVGGKLGVKIYVSTTADFAYSSTAFVKVTCAGEEIDTVALKTLPTDEATGYKVLTAYVAAKQMTDEIKAEVFANSTATTALSSKATTIKAYCDYMIETSSNSSLVAFCKKMLNYGAYAQTFFGYNTSKLANVDLSAADKSVASVTADTLSAYTNEVIRPNTKFVKAIKSFSATLVEETELNFIIEEGEDFNSGYEYKCTDGLNNYEVETDYKTYEKEGYTLLKIKGIAAKALGKDLILSVEPKSNSSTLTTTIEEAPFVVKFTALSYAKAVLADTTGYASKNLKNLAAAFYLYNTHSVDYFDSERTISTKFQGISSKYDEYEVNSAKAFLESTTEEGKEVEKFIITVPAEIDSEYGVGEVTITYIKDNKLNTIPASEYEISYNEANGVTTIAINKAAVPSGVELMLDIKISETLDYMPDKNALLNVTSSNKKVFYGEEYKTVLKAADGMALPGEVKVYSGNVTVTETKVGDVVTDINVATKSDPDTANGWGAGKELTAGKEYSYDAITGELVIFAPVDAITIHAEAVESHTIIPNLYNLTADMPATCGSGFSTTISVTDDSKYKVPTDITVYGTDDDVVAGYYSKLNEDGKTRTYYVVGAKTETEVTGSNTSALTNTSTAAQKEEAQLKDIKAMNPAATSSAPVDQCYYIVDLDKDETSATFTVQNLTGDEIVVIARAVEYVSVSIDMGDNLVYSSEEITYDSTKKQYVTKAPATTVNKNGTVAPIYIALNSTDESLIIPSADAITVKMNGVTLKTTDYKIEDVTPTNGNKVENKKLTITKAVTGNVEIIAEATEQYTLGFNLSGNLALKTMSGEAYTKGQDLSIGDFTGKLVASGNYVLPASITVKINGKVVDPASSLYAYNDTTGEIVVYGLGKGDELVIEAAATQTYSVNVMTSDSGVVVTPESSSVLGGRNVTCTVKLPTQTDTTATYSVSEINVRLNSELGTKVTDDSTKSTYYTYNAATGKLVVYNVTTDVFIGVECAKECDINFEVTGQTGKLALKNATFTMAKDVVYANTEVEAEVTVAGVETGYEVILKNVEYTTDGGKTYTSILKSAAGTTQCKLEKHETKANVYVLTIPKDTIEGDVRVTVDAQTAEYTVNRENVPGFYVIKNGDTAVTSDTKVDYDDNLKWSVSVTDPAMYKLPTTAVVKMGGKVVEGAYSLDYATDGKTLTGTATIKVDGVSGNIEVDIDPIVVVKTTSVEDTAALTGANLEFQVSGGTVIDDGDDSTNKEDAYFYNTADGSITISAMLTGTDAYKYNLAGVAKTFGTDENNKTDYTDVTSNDVVVYVGADTTNCIDTEEEYKANLEAVKNGSTTDLEDYNNKVAEAEALPYYTYNAGTIVVYNATDYITVGVKVNEKKALNVTAQDSTNTTKAYNITNALRVEAEALISNQVNGTALLMNSTDSADEFDMSDYVIVVAKLDEDGNSTTEYVYNASAVITPVLAVADSNGGYVANSYAQVGTAKVDYYKITGLTSYASNIKFMNKEQVLDVDTEGTGLTLSKVNDVNATETNKLVYGSTNNVLTFTGTLAADTEFKVTIDGKVAEEDEYKFENNKLTIKTAVTGVVTVEKKK